MKQTSFVILTLSTRNLLVHYYPGIGLNTVTLFQELQEAKHHEAVDFNHMHFAI